MAMQIRGNTQIVSGTITADRLVASLGLPTAQLAEGADFIKRTGSVAYTADQPMGGFQLTGLGAPTSSTHAATKAYVDSVATGLDAKGSVRAATTGNIALTGTQTVDGVALSVGNRVLVKSQTTPSENGIYVVSAGVWSRSTDADTDAEVTSGMFTFVEEGTTNGDSGWVLSSDGAITVGTTGLTFVQFSSAGSITGGAGIAQTGNTLSITNTDSSLNIGADDLSIKRDVAGAIGVSGAGLAINVGTGIEISGNALRIAAAAAGAGISYTNGVLDIAVGAATGLAITTDTIGIKLDGSSLALSASGVKIADPGAGKVLMGGSTGAAVANTISGDISISNTGVVTVASTIPRKADYIGQPETLAGTPNGVLTAFTLANTPVAGTLAVYQNGILQRPTTDYSIGGTTITFTTAPASGDWLSVIYMK